MEENKSKKSGGVSLILVVAILLLALAGCIGYIVKNSEHEIAINNNNSEQTINALKSEIDSLKNTIAQKDNEIKNYENKEPVVQTKEMTADERFTAYAKGLKQSLSKFYEFGEVFDGKKYQCKVPVDFDVADERIEDINIDYNGELYLKFTSNSDLAKKYGTNYKLASNIIKAGAMQMGQDVSTFIYAINYSGEFLCCRVEQNANNNLKLKVINKLKNIVEIQRYSNGETGALLVAIDIDGKMYDIKDYI